MKQKGVKTLPSPVLGEGLASARGEGRLRRFSTSSPTLLLRKEKGATITFLLIACIVIISVFLFLQNKPCANFNQESLLFPTQSITIAVANTSAQQEKGLSGCKYIPDYAGMYFSFSDPQTQIFWMKNMVIPIDIVWLLEGRVVGIEKNVPNYPLDTRDNELPTYKSPVPVDAVLEVGAGKADTYGIKEGVTAVWADSGRRGGLTGLLSSVILHLFYENSSD